MDIWFLMWVISLLIVLPFIWCVAGWGLRQHDELTIQRKETAKWRADSNFWLKECIKLETSQKDTQVLFTVPQERRCYAQFV